MTWLFATAGRIALQYRQSPMQHVTEGSSPGGQLAGRENDCPLISVSYF
jgi:hypothetical protein